MILYLIYQNKGLSRKALAAKTGLTPAAITLIIGDMLREKDESVVAVLSSVSDDKITFNAVCGKKAVAAGIKAGDLIRTVTAITGGSGGGKPDSAMGGGKDPLMLDNALAVVDNYVSEHVKK